MPQKTSYAIRKNSGTAGKNSNSRRYSNKKYESVVKHSVGFLKGSKFVNTKNRKLLVLLNYLATFSLIGVVAVMVLSFFVVVYYSRELPDPNRLLERSFELSTKFYDRDGKPIYEIYGEKNRSLITLDQVSPSIINATLATEDAQFYQHKGYSFRGIARALKNMISGENLQSGSTLTQQVIKNTLLTQEQTITRKIKEFILSLQLENAYSKEEILQMYLNETPYGGQSYGILTAAKAFFNKLPNELTIAEAAYLAGLPQRPSYYSYYGSNPEAGLERKDYVLYLMNVRGWVDKEGKKYFLSDEEYEAAKNEKLSFQTTFLPFKAPHYVLYVRQLLADKFGEEAVQQGGLQVTTSLDLELQESAEAIVFDEVERSQNLNVGNGGLVAIDPKTGQILAMVGSKGYFLKSEPEGCISGITGENSCTFEPNLNVSLARRQPGSSIKPITYSVMLSQGYTVAYPLVDVPTSFPGSAPDKPYNPENYDGKFRGPMPIRKSLGNSINISAVKALKIVGLDSMIDQAEAMGISTLKERQRYGLALTLGGGETKLLEMTNAFAVFASKGVYREPVTILEVKDSTGNEIYKWRDNGGDRVLSEDVSFLISDILSDDGARSEVFGFGSLLNIPGHQVAVKTGTTDDKRDNWAIGFTPSVAAGVWVGNNNNDAMNPVLASGISGATPIWNRFMKEFLKDKENEKFSPPKNIEKHTVDKLTGMQPYGDHPVREEWFVKGTEPTAKSPWYQELEICKEDEKLANDSCKQAGKTEIKTFVKVLAERSEWQTEVDKWVYENYNDQSEYFPPQTQSHLVYEGGDLKDDDKVYVDVVGLKDGQTVPLSFRLSVEVSSAKDVERVNIYVDGEQITSDESEPFGYNFAFKPDQIGEHEFEATATDENGNKGTTKLKLKVGNF